MVKLPPAILLLAGLLASAASYADFDSSSGGSPPNQGPGVGHNRRAGTRKGPKSKKNDARTVRGVCSIVASPSNQFPGPCVSLSLVLNDGHETIKSRTTTQGQFEFDVEPGKQYKLTPGSKFYDVVSPSVPVRGGDAVRLTLRQK